MMEAIKSLFGLGPKTNYAAIIKKGGIILDVRSRQEYDGGHINGSVNIPVNELPAKLKMLKDKNQPIITCCASGMRSASAGSLLRASGYAEVYNGGGWYGLQRKL